MQRWIHAATAAVVVFISGCAQLAPQSVGSPQFVNGLVIPGETLDRTGLPSANQGRFGFFSDLAYDRQRNEWWALSDRGPGGGVIAYETRVQRFSIDHDRATGAISNFRVVETVRLIDSKGLLTAPTAPVARPVALNGLSPQRLNGNSATLGRSFDPEGLVVSPISGNLLISDEYGPSVCEFSRSGELLKVFETPANLRPRLRGDDGSPGAIDLVQGRAERGVYFGRQDNRGFEGLAISPDGKRVYAVLQDPLMNEPGPNNGRDGRNLRIVAFDSDPASTGYGRALAQYVYQLEPQAEVALRINAIQSGSASPTEPRQGRNIGVSALAAINDTDFLILERDNRGLGLDDPAGTQPVGSKRIYRISIAGATDVTAIALGADALPAGVKPVGKSALFIDLAAHSVLPNGRLAEKWEGLAIGPRLADGSYLIVTGVDNDYSVTQNASNVQFDLYVDFKGNSLTRDLDEPTKLEGKPVSAPPAGFVLLPGVLHAYKVSATSLPGYVEPGARR